MAPPPRGPTISYGPSRVSGGSAMDATLAGGSLPRHQLCRDELLSKKGHRPFPRQFRRRFVVCIGPIRFEEPVPGARVRMKGDRATGRPQSVPQTLDLGCRFIVVGFPEVAEIGRLRSFVVSTSGAIEDHNGPHAVRILRRETQRKVDPEGKTNHSEVWTRKVGAPAQEADGLGDVGLGLGLVELLAASLGVLDRGCNLAVIQVGRKGHETLRGQPLAKRFDGLIQSPPGMQDQQAWTLARGGGGEKPLWLPIRHWLSSVSSRLPSTRQVWGPPRA